jgi:hypothetical protein
MKLDGGNECPGVSLVYGALLHVRSTHNRRPR